MAWYMYLVYPMLLVHFEITRLMNMTAILQTSFWNKFHSLKMLYIDLDAKGNWSE